MAKRREKLTRDGLRVVSKNAIKEMTRKDEELRQQGDTALINYVAQQLETISSRNNELVEEVKYIVKLIDLKTELNLLSSDLKQAHLQHSSFVMPYILLGGLEKEDFPVVTRSTIDSFSREVKPTERISWGECKKYRHIMKEENPLLHDFSFSRNFRLFTDIYGGRTAIPGSILFICNYELLRRQSKIDKESKER